MKIDFLKPKFKDFKLISDAERVIFGKKFNIKLIREYINNSGYAMIVKINGKYVGHIISKILSEESEIITFLILPDFQRKGIGRRLMVNFSKDLSIKGVKDIFLEVSVNNFQALEFYLSLGFNSVGVRPLYYKDGNERSDAKILQGNSENIKNLMVK